MPGPASPGSPAEGPGGLGRAGGLLGGRGSARRRRGEPRRRRRREERAEQPLLRETLQTKKAPDSPQPLAPQAGPLAPNPRPSGHCNFPPGLWPPRGGPRVCVRVFVRPALSGAPSQACLSHSGHEQLKLAPYQSSPLPGPCWACSRSPHLSWPPQFSQVSLRTLQAC